MNTFNLTVASPDGNKFKGEVIKLDVRGVEGELAVMAGHIPFVTSVAAAPCTIHISENEKIKATCDGGLLSVDTDSVTLISGSFEIK